MVNDRIESVKQRWVIGITGASGSVYGVRLCQFLLARGDRVHLIITDAGWRVLSEELGWNAAKRRDTLDKQFSNYEGTYEYHPIQDIGASIASGSFRTDGMVIAPCSMGTLASIAHGMSDNLLERAADVMIKEKRKLIIVPRETPLHGIHLENMLKLDRHGVTLIPAMPAFYFKPKTIDDLVDFVVGRILDSMNVDHQLFQRWGTQFDE